MPEWSFADRVPRGTPAESSPAAPTWRAGERLGPFELVRELGSGGRGVVFLARDASGERIALKLIKGCLTPQSVQRFEREGAVAAALGHPGVVALRSSGYVGEIPFLAYELVEGARSLREAVEGRSDGERVGLVLQAARALGYAHAQGVVHRDVKPENLLVDPAGRVRVSDFGLARLDTQGGLTTTGQILGTPWYMAPEQFFPDSSGATIDVWALGVVLYELLTGHLPFRGPTLGRLISQVNSLRPLPPRQRNPTMSAELEAVILGALAREPKDRYADASVLAAKLEGVRR